MLYCTCPVVVEVAELEQYWTELCDDLASIEVTVSPEYGAKGLVLSYKQQS